MHNAARYHLPHDQFTPTTPITLTTGSTQPDSPQHTSFFLFNFLFKILYVQKDAKSRMCASLVAHQHRGDHMQNQTDVCRV
jgi:hypothetical protein